MAGETIRKTKTHGPSPIYDQAVHREELKMTGPTSTTGNSGFLHKLVSSAVYRRKMCTTLLLYFDYFAFAWLYGTIGPSLPDLQEIVHVDLQAASWIFTCFAIGYMAGCVVHGFLYNRINNVLLCAIYAVASGVLWIVTPLCHYYWLMLVVRFLGGTVWGCSDSGIHCELFAIWGAEAGPFSELLYLALSLGGLASTFAIKPFLEAPVNSSSPWNSAIATERFNTTMDAVYGTTYNTSTTIAVTDGSAANIKWAYLIAGCVSILASLPLFVDYIRVKCFGDNIHDKIDDKSEQAPTKANGRSRAVFFTAMVLLSLITLIITGVIDTYAGFVPTFTLHQMGWTKRQGALAESVFYVSFAVGNIVCMLLYLVLSTKVLLMSSLIGSVVALIGLVVSALFHLNAGVWVFDVACGFFMSPLWPAFFTYVEEYVIPVAGKVASAFLFIGATGMCLNPLIIGYTMGALSPMWFGYVLLGECVVMAGLFAIVLYLCRTSLNTYENI